MDASGLLQIENLSKLELQSLEEELYTLLQEFEMLYCNHKIARKTWKCQMK